MCNPRPKKTKNTGIQTEGSQVNTGVMWTRMCDSHGQWHLCPIAEKKPKLFFLQTSVTVIVVLTWSLELYKRVGSRTSNINAHSNIVQPFIHDTIKHNMTCLVAIYDIIVPQKKKHKKMVFSCQTWLERGTVKGNFDCNLGTLTCKCVNPATVIRLQFGQATKTISPRVMRQWITSLHEPT